MLLALVTAAILSAEVPTTATMTGDLDGSGAAETITATRHGQKIRLEVSDARGKRLARADTPSPKPEPSRVEIDGGSLGSAGELVQVVVLTAGGEQECRALWRYRDGTLSHVPVIRHGSPIPDCGETEGWTYRWAKSRPDGPADYLRERTRETPDGPHHQTEVYRYTGFRVELDAARSSAEIGGVPIPSWPAAVLYPRPALDRLYSRFDLSPLRMSPRLRFETDQEKGIFAAILDRPEGSERLRVSAAAPGKEKDEIELTLRSGEKTGGAHIRLSADRSGPFEVLLRGLGEDAQPAFVPVTTLNGSTFELYETAEVELALLGLSGTWDATNGERLEISLSSASPPVLRVGSSELALDIARAPEGTDIALIPRNGSSPTWALRLRGPNVFARFRVSCPPASAAAKSPCRTEGESQVFRRLGASIAVH